MYFFFNVNSISILGENIQEETIGFLINQLPMLSYLSLRKCHEVNNEYLMSAIQLSHSPCLKINTWLGIMTWKSSTNEYHFDKWKKPDYSMEEIQRNMRQQFAFSL